MKVTKEALVASRALHGLNTVSLGVGGSCDEEQVMSDVASLVQASLAHPSSEATEVLSVSQADAHSVTSMLWSSEGILRQALLSPGLVNFSGPDEEKQTKDSTSLDLVNMKATGTPLPPMSQLTRPGSLPGTMSLGPSPEGQSLLAQSLEDENRSSTVAPSGGLDSSLLDLHSSETFSGAFPCSVSYKLSSSPELLTSHASMDPLPPISEVHKAAAGLMSSSVSSRDQLLSSEGRDKDLSTYQPSSSPLPSDVAGSLLLSSARGPLPTMSSSQVSSLLSALNSDLSNPELPGKELSSLGEIELSPPRKLDEQLGLGTAPKVPVLQLHLSPSPPQKVSTLTQTDQLDELENLIPLAPTSSSSISETANKILSEADQKSAILNQLKLTPSFTRVVSHSKCITNPTFSIPLDTPVLTLEECQQPTLVVVKQEKVPASNQGGSKKRVKAAEPKKPRVRKKKVVEAEPKSLVERVACFKCSICPFLSLDKVGVDVHIQEEHEGLTEAPSLGQSDLPAQELRCPGCPNVFFTVQALQVHLCQDHRVSDSEVQQILDCLCPPALLQIADSAASEVIDGGKQERRPRKKSRVLPPPSDVEVYTDEQGKIHVRQGPRPTPDPSAPETACSSGGDACESSDNDMEPPTAGSQEEEAVAGEGESAVKKRGRPRGSRNIGITALKRQNPSLRLGEKELGYCCAVNGCAVRLRSHDNIEYHRRCHSAASETSLFACPECRHNFSQWRILTAHLWRAHVIDMELYACDQCSFKTNSYSKLINLHKRIHGIERPFLCDNCGKGFKTSKQLRNHKTIHNNGVRNRPLKSGECDICFRHFADKRMLRMHKDTVHEKLRPFLCNYCGYSASSRSTLKMHMRQHTGEKPFACPECEYRTADHNSLRRHRMRHSGQKQYQCPHCAYACIQSSTYKTHLRNKHPGQDDGLLFSCPHCPFRTIKRENHAAHLAEHQSGAIAASSSSGATSPPASKPSRAKPSAQSVKPSTPSGTVVSVTEIKPPNSSRKGVSASKAPNGGTAASNSTKKKQQQASASAKKRQQAKILKAAEEVVREVECPRRASKAKAASSPAVAPAPPQAETSKPMVVSVASTVVRAAASQMDHTGVMPENLHFLYATSGGGITTLESLLQPCFSGSDDIRYPLLSSQLKMSLGDLGSPVFTVLDGKQLLQLSPAELVPISLSSAQASALQLALSAGSGEPEQITGDLAEGASQLGGGGLGEAMEVKFKVTEDLHGSS